MVTLYQDFGEFSRVATGNYEHIAPSVRTCRGSIYLPAMRVRKARRAGRTRNDGRHKCRPYKDLKRKFLYYQVKGIIPMLNAMPRYNLDTGKCLWLCSGHHFPRRKYPLRRTL